MIDLQCTDVATMIAGLPDGCSTLIHADPPWKYGDGVPGHGKAQAHYGGLPDDVIARHLAATYRLVPDDGYLAVWCTFPKLFDWARQDDIMRAAKWEYISGGAWGKTNGIGCGHHFRGDAEVCLLYKKGNPHPLNGSKTNLWLAHRQIHSEKPQTALCALVSMGAPVGGLVVDCYAGESASLARACRALGRGYIGAELDPARHALALARFSQQEMFGEAA